jgi:hypothetical protein
LTCDSVVRPTFACQSVGSAISPADQFTRKP